MKVKNYSRKFLIIAISALFALNVNAQTSVKLTGTISGISGSHNDNPDVTYDKWLDGDLNTYGDVAASSSDEAWGAIDFGAGNKRVITSVKLALRNQTSNEQIWKDRMAGTRIYGANSINPTTESPIAVNMDNGGDLLYTISVDEANSMVLGELKEFTIPANLINTTGYRYAVVIAGTRHGNLGEVEFWGYEPATASVEDVFASSLSVYPNPATTNLTIKSKNILIESVEVYNMLGKKVLKGSINNDRIDVSSLTSGIYMLKVNSVNSSSTRKIVIK